MALAFFSASCQQENLEPVMSGNTVTYTVQVADAVATKALGDDVRNVNKLHYEVYRTSEAETTDFGDTDRLLYHKTADVINGTAKIEVELVNDQNFTVLFWAQVEKEGFNSPYVVTDLTNVRIKTDSELDLGKAHKANQVDYAAFSYVDFIKSTDQLVSKTVELTRPVAQLNIGTTYESLTTFKTPIKINGSSVTVTGLSNTFDVAKQAASGEYTATYKYTETAAPSEEPLVVNGKEYKYVGMNYVGFAYKSDNKSDNTLITVSYGINTTEGNIDNTIVNVPVKPNYRTNIIGNLITSKTDYTITLKDDWYTPEEVVECWNGSEMNAPSVSATNENIYEIEFPSELAWLAAAVNGTLPETRAANAPKDFAGMTFVLTKDIDLYGQEWTPIGTANNIFKGTFDGQGHTVKNLKISGYNSNVGFFGVTHDGEIKNFTVENAEVSGRLNVGVVAGQPYTSKYTDITVKGLVKVEGMAYVGGVGGKNAYADWTNIKVEVDETSYVKAHSIENNTAYRTYVGGVVGFNGEGGHKFSNITSNINVEGSTCDVGGLFGIAHYGNQFEKCSCSGDVNIYAAEEAEEAQEIGGIAGVWHNETSYSVTMTECSFTGNLTTNIEGVEFYNGGLVGKPYSATGTGKLIIDGAVYVASAAELQAAVTAATGETLIKLGADIEGNVTVIQKQGVKITIDGNGKKYNGAIKVHSNSNYYADAALTIKNVNFETSAASINCIEALENGSQRYSQNITVENCTFTATGEAVNTSVAVQVKATRGVTVKDCTATDMHSLIQAQSCDTGDVKVLNCTVNGKNGVAFKQVKSATVEGTTITALEYGIRFDGNIDNYGIVVKDNNVTAVQPFIVRKMTGKNNTIALEGTNTLTTEAEYQIVITNGSDDQEYVKPTGTYTLTGADSFSVYPRDYYYPVATWDEFTAALAAGEESVKLTDNITYEGASSYNLKNNVVVELNGKTFTTGNASTTWLNIMGSKATFKGGIIEGKVYVQKNGSTYSDATFENVTFGGTITFSSVTQGSLAVQGGNSVYAKKCTFKGKGSTTPNVVSLEGTSSGSTIFEDCTFNSTMNRFYANPRNGTAIFKLINCSFNKAAVVETDAKWDFVNNMTITGSKSSGVNLYIGKAKDNLTDAEKAVLDEYKKNNKGAVYCNSVKY